jgi:hypothetical protein
MFESEIRCGYFELVVWTILGIFERHHLYKINFQAMDYVRHGEIQGAMWSFLKLTALYLTMFDIVHI